MSYSIGATRPIKAELESAIRDALAKVQTTQPDHEVDIDQAFNTAKSLIDLMHDDPARDLYCEVSGFIWKTEAGAESVSFSINVSHKNRE